MGCVFDYTGISYRVDGIRKPPPGLASYSSTHNTAPHHATTFGASETGKKYMRTDTIDEEHAQQPKAAGMYVLRSTYVCSCYFKSSVIHISST